MQNIIQKKNYLFIGPTDIKECKYVRKSEKYISNEAYKDYKKKFISKNSIMIDCIGSDMGNVAISVTDVLTNQQINSITNIDEKKFNVEYIYYILSTMKKYFHQIGTNGSTMPIINKTMFEDIIIDIPDKETQDKITSILSKLDQKIELNNQINNNLQEFINNLYIKYFINFDEYCGEYKESDLGMIPESFEVDTLGEVITFSNGYGWNSKDMLDSSVENSYKVFKMGNINIGGGINKSKTKSWIKKDKANNLEQYISKKGDILMCMTDMKNSGNPLLGHTALIDKDDEFVINQRVGIIKCNKKLGYSYIYTMSNLKHFINDIRSRANSGVQVNLTTKGICDTLVLVPDDITLNKFQKTVKPLYEKIFNNNNENEILEQLRDILLPKLMNGEIDLNKIDI